MDESLKKYIAAARAKKLSTEEIKASLLDAGWREEQFRSAFSNPKSNLLVPPPPPQTSQVAHIGMWVGFLYIIFFISLYVLATSVSWLLHIAIDKTITNPANGYTFFSSHTSEIRNLIASIIVSYPMFLTLALVLRKQTVKQPAIKSIRSRKILIYITLIGAFLIMLWHIIQTITAFLAGIITTEALLHIGVTFLIAGAIFWYFIDDVKTDRKNA